MSHPNAPHEPAPLYSRDAELSVIGGMFIDREAIPIALEWVSESDFFIPKHRKAFRAMVRLHEQGEVVDPITLSEQLKGAKDWEDVGGASFVAHLMDAVPSAANIVGHAKRVARFAALRALEAATKKIQAEIQDAGTQDAAEVFGTAEAILQEATPVLRGKPFIRLKDELWPAMERVEAIGTERAVPTIKCGVEEVDELTGGFRRKDLIVIAGRPSMGKSAFGVCNVIGHAAIWGGKVAALFSIESSKEEVTDRIIASQARVNLSGAKRRGNVRDEDYVRISNVAGALSKAHLYLDNEVRTIDRMRAKLRQLKRDVGQIDIVAVDYLQRMNAPQYGINRTQEISYISSELKEIAKEFDCVMVALAQLSRKVEERPDKRPVLSDLKESGGIEQDADVILLLYRPEYYFGPTMKQGKGRDAPTVSIEGKAEVIAGKVRDGQTGSAHVAFRKEFTLFESLTHAPH